MDEQQWLSCREYRPVLALHRKVTSSRKWRLFATACCRLLWHLIPQESRKVVEVAEEFVERRASDKDREAARRPDIDFFHDHPAVLAAHLSAEPTARIKTVARYDVPVKCVAAVSMEEGKKPRAACIARIAGLVRDVFGNPFRAISLDPGWRTPDVLSLAQAAYDQRSLPAGTLDPTRLTLLADALEEAGCTDAQLLGHLRSEGPHVRGCWAVDLVLRPS